MNDAQAAFYVMDLSMITRMAFVFRTLLPSFTYYAAEEYDALLKWASASRITEEGAKTTGLASLDKDRTDRMLMIG